MIRHIEFDYGNRLVDCLFPERKVMILRGDKSLGEYLMNALKSVLGCDYSGTLKDGASQVFNGDFRAMFDDFEVSVKADRSVHYEGNEPHVHCISLEGDSVQSFFVTSDIKKYAMMEDLTHLSPSISYNVWVRLVSMINSFAGFNFCTLGNDLTFAETDSKYLYYCYLLLAECIATPDGMYRLVLIPDCDIPQNKRFEFLNLLVSLGDNIRVLTTMDVEDIPAGRHSMAYIDI